MCLVNSTSLGCVSLITTICLCLVTLCLRISNSDEIVMFSKEVLIVTMYLVNSASLRHDLLIARTHLCWLTMCLKIVISDDENSK